MARREIILCFVIALLSVAAARAEEPAELDLDIWQHMPSFHQGRMMPVNTFARLMAEEICGRANPRLGAEAQAIFPGGNPRRFTAAELLLSWIVEPQRWERVPFLLAEHEELRSDLLDLPVVSEQGRRLKFVSPRQLESASKFRIRLEEISAKQAEARAEGKSPELSTLDKKATRLYNVYTTYRLLTFNPRDPAADRSRFFSKMAEVIHGWKKLEPDLKRFLPGQPGEGTAGEQGSGGLVAVAGDAIGKLMETLGQGEVVVEDAEPLVVTLCQSTERIAEQFAEHRDRVFDDPAPAELEGAQLKQVRTRMQALAAKTADLARLACEAHLALYDNGLSLRLVPALNPAALEKNRDPDDDAQPWLNLQTVILGSPEVLAGYPLEEVDEVRNRFRALAEAYTNRDSPGRSEQVAAAIEGFSAAVRALGQALEPVRKKLPIKHKDEALITATAYPPPGAMRAEVHYYRLDPFFWSWLVSFAAMVCFGLAFGVIRKPMFWFGILVLVVAQGFTIYGFGLRVYITGWAPVTNMFETVLFVALTVALFGLWFTLLPLTWAVLTRPLDLLRHGTARPMQQVFARQPIALVGVSVAFLAALVAYYAPVSGKGISPLMPVLRNNFWLAMHVLSITASYGAGALAWGLGNIALGYYLFGRYRDPVTPSAAAVAQGHRPAHGYHAPSGTLTRRPPEACAALGTFTYKSMLVALSLLIAGTVLGAFWADVSWGRFWGWDPKEVWALISVLIYVAVLHGRPLGWWGNFGLAAGSVVGATSILMAWYGVNYVLPAGLHSYGSGTGGLVPVLCIVAANWVFIILAGVRYFVEVRLPLALVPPTSAQPAGENG